MGLILVALSAGGDWLTGPDFAFSIFYLAPIILVTDRLGARAGLVIALLSAIAWLMADVGSARMSTLPWAHYWNVTVRFGFFTITALLVAALRREQTLARRDFVTGIHNRQALLEFLEAEIERARRYRRPFSFALLDVDRFKAVNDTRGHDAGDRVLRDVATVLSQHTRTVDVVARFGGDEFAVLLPETNAAAATVAVRRIQAGFQTLRRRDGACPSLSIGLVTFALPSANADEVIKRADAALYAAKRAGGDTLEHEVID